MSGPERIPLRKVTRASLTINITLLVMVACTVVGLLFLDGRDVRLFAFARPAHAAVARETTFLSASAATVRDSPAPSRVQ